jgi:hypothetical protein
MLIVWTVLCAMTLWTLFLLTIVLCIAIKLLSSELPKPTSWIPPAFSDEMMSSVMDYLAIRMYFARANAEREPLYKQLLKKGDKIQNPTRCNAPTCTIFSTKCPFRLSYRAKGNNGRKRIRSNNV